MRQAAALHFGARNIPEDHLASRVRSARPFGSMTIDRNAGGRRTRSARSRPCPSMPAPTTPALAIGSGAAGAMPGMFPSSRSAKNTDAARRRRGRRAAAARRRSRDSSARDRAQTEVRSTPRPRRSAYAPPNRRRLRRAPSCALERRQTAWRRQREARDARSCVVRSDVRRFARAGTHARKQCQRRARRAIAVDGLVDPRHFLRARLRSVDQVLALEHHLQGASCAPMRRGRLTVPEFSHGTRNQAKADLGETEFGAADRHAVVAGQREFDRAAKSSFIKCSDVAFSRRSARPRR